MIEKITIQRTSVRNRIVRTLGLDSDIAISLIDDSDQFSMFRPRIYNRKNALCINYVVFNEVFGYLIYKLKYTPGQAKDKIFSYLRSHNIYLLKKSETDLNKLGVILDSLKKQREVLKNSADDKDLLIISVYKCHEIDCIVGRNSRHFEPFCKFLKIEFEPVKTNIDMMWKDAFGWRRKR